MALFPAYSQDPVSVSQEDAESWDIAERSILDTSPGSTPSPSHEHDLLEPSPPPQPTPQPPPPPAMDFYEDRKRDPCNIPVSTLYYPGRPQYKQRKCDSLSSRKRRKVLRYYSVTGDRGGALDIKEARGGRYRAAIEGGAGRETWCEYIHYLAYYQEDISSALQVCEEAIQRGIDVHDTWHQLLQEKLTSAQYADFVKDLLDKEACPTKRCILWTRYMLSLSLPRARDAAAKALDDVRKADYLYSNVLHVYGCILRNAGFWEEMVQLVDLVLEVSGAGRGLKEIEGEKGAEEELDQYEMKLISSGLPLGEVWRRVELARASLHWRPLPGGDPSLDADPQRGPSEARAAELLRPITDKLSWFRVCVWAVLSLESILPGSHTFTHTTFGTPYIWLAHFDSPPAVLQLLYSSRKLPGLSEDRVKDVLNILPVRNYSKCVRDPSGFGSFVDNVWHRCLTSSSGLPRLALLMMKLKAEVNRVRLFTIQGNADEARRVISSCRLLIKKFGDNAPLPLAILARAEFAANKNVRERAERAPQLLRRALNAAILDDSVPECHALYIARVLSEITTDSTLTSWATISAVLRKTLPDDVTTSLPNELKLAAILRCEEKCSQLEEKLKTSEEPWSIWETLTCSPIEWGPARIFLLSGEERGKMLKGLAKGTIVTKEGTIVTREGTIVTRGVTIVTEGPMASYEEICACALLDKASYQERRQFVNVFADRFPCNTYLAMMSAECTSWWDIPNPHVTSVRSRVRGLAGVIYGVRGNQRRLKGLAKGLAAVGKGETAILSAITSSPSTRWLLLLPSPAPLARAELLQANQMRLHALPDELVPFT